jgi:hypothetical protein
MWSMPRTVFLAGHGRLPQSTAAQSQYENVVITVEIDPKYSVVVRASCNLVTDLARDFLANLFVGYSLRDGIEPLIEEVKRCYQGKAQNALIAALKDLGRTYEAWQS